ncbi:pyridoxal phosphate-dependent aminotransferase [Oceanobacillus luteolus]|uniref:MalY/PatB family protein n=1 Tax=Oceanobacillus luteolus TaxID=1274358 RepID=UPI00203F0576|nr:MalY/PatB family protein [Oceanobacillus luteolus]MCM3740198.1 pyridoxal phosphate-dependent aminotransferase [Oceanobacillus luteolus]
MGNFDEVINRWNTKSVKWDLVETLFQSKDVIPMWVADMDFKAPQEVNEAIIKRAEHGVYGYTLADHAFKESIINWNKERHNWSIQPEWLTFSSGVVASLHMAIQAFSEPNDGILIQTPVYPPFYNSINALDRTIIKNPLIFQDNYYTIDFADFEEKLKQVKVFILCSPHNPVGRVWRKDELEEMARLCIKHNVLIISDEIHGDLVYPGKKHIPIASLSEEIANQTITCMAPSKTFNVAGLAASYCITSNEEYKRLLDKAFNKQGFHSDQLNTMGQVAMEAAYTYGAPWVDELNTLLESHYHFVKESFEKHAPELNVVKSEGTYLLWIDCSGLKLNAKELREFFVKEAKVGLNAGKDYGEEGEQFMRMNVGCPRETLEEAVERIIEAVKRNRI